MKWRDLSGWNVMSSNNFTDVSPEPTPFIFSFEGILSKLEVCCLLLSCYLLNVLSNLQTGAVRYSEMSVNFYWSRHEITSKKTALLIVTNLRTSNRTQNEFFTAHAHWFLTFIYGGHSTNRLLSLDTRRITWKTTHPTILLLLRVFFAAGTCVTSRCLAMAWGITLYRAFA
jgi:hypothetical protein